jgi:hypothetical protein
LQAHKECVRHRVHQRPHAQQRGGCRALPFHLSQEKSYRHSGPFLEGGLKCDLMLLLRAVF